MLSVSLFFFLMIRRPPRSTPLSLHDALPISFVSLVEASEPPRKSVAFTVQPGIRHAPRRGARRSLLEDRKSTPSELQSQSNLVCRLLLEKKNSPLPVRDPTVVEHLQEHVNNV